MEGMLSDHHLHHQHQQHQQQQHQQQQYMRNPLRLFPDGVSEMDAALLTEKARSALGMSLNLGLWQPQPRPVNAGVPSRVDQLNTALSFLNPPVSSSAMASMYGRTNAANGGGGGPPMAPPPAPPLLVPWAMRGPGGWRPGPSRAPGAQSGAAGGSGIGGGAVPPMPLPQAAQFWSQWSMMGLGLNQLGLLGLGFPQPQPPLPTQVPLAHNAADNPQSSPQSGRSSLSSHSSQSPSFQRYSPYPVHHGKRTPSPPTSAAAAAPSHRI